MIPEILTVTEFSKRTGMPARTVRQRCDEGLIPHTVLSYGKRTKNRLIFYQEFLQLMQQHKVAVRSDRIDKRPGVIRLQEILRDNRRYKNVSKGAVSK